MFTLTVVQIKGQNLHDPESEYLLKFRALGTFLAYPSPSLVTESESSFWWGVQVICVPIKTLRNTALACSLSFPGLGFNYNSHVVFGSSDSPKLTVSYSS